MMESKEINPNKIILNSIDDLIKLGKRDILTTKQYSEIIQSCSPFIGIFLNDYQNTIEMAEILDEFFKKWKHGFDKPIFIDQEK